MLAGRYQFAFCRVRLGVGGVDYTLSYRSQTLGFKAYGDIVIMGRRREEMNGMCIKDESTHSRRRSNKRNKGGNTPRFSYQR